MLYDGGAIIMRHSTIKHKVIKLTAFLALVCSSLISTSLQAVIPPGQLTQAEQDLLLVEMGKIKNYLGNIITDTNNLFSTKDNFAIDLKKLQAHRDEIKAIAANAPLGGSSQFAQFIFKSNKALTEKLRDAQVVWVSALEKKTLQAIDAVSSLMDTLFDRSKAQLLGGNNAMLEGLKGALTREGYEGLSKLAHSIYIDVDYVFFFHARTNIFEGSIRDRMQALGKHLTKFKGFSGSITISMLSKFIWAQTPPPAPKP